jgi:hypothetical protein
VTAAFIATMVPAEQQPRQVQSPCKPAMAAGRHRHEHEQRPPPVWRPGRIAINQRKAIGPPRSRKHATPPHVTAPPTGRMTGRLHPDPAPSDHGADAVRRAAFGAAGKGGDVTGHDAGAGMQPTSERRSSDPSGRGVVWVGRSSRPGTTLPAQRASSGSTWERPCRESLYRAFGFKEVEPFVVTMPDSVTLDAVVMERVIDSL